MNVKFSIIVPVYNTERYLAECIESVLNQNYNSYELILVDNGSTDNSRKIMDKYKKNPNVKVVTFEANQGISKARNAGIQEAVGEYIIFLDSDDFYREKNVLQKLAEMYKEKKPDMMIFRVLTYYNDSKKFGKVRSNFNPEEVNKREKEEIIRYLVQHGYFESAAWNKVIKRSIIMEHNLEFVDGIRGEDIEWYVRVLEHVHTISAIEGEALAHRIDSNSTSHTGWNMKCWTDIYHILEEKAGMIHNKKKDELYYLDNYVRFWFILLGYTESFEEAAELREKLKEISNYSKLCFNRRTRIYRMILMVFGYKGAAKVFYKYIMR